MVKPPTQEQLAGLERSRYRGPVQTRDRDTARLTWLEAVERALSDFAVRPGGFLTLDPEL